MKRRRRHGSHENHERWLVSYADFITLLFAFFVVMFATTQSDKAKAKEVSDSVREALEHGQLGAVISGALKKKESAKALPNPPTEAPQAAPTPPADLHQPLAKLHQEVSKEVEAGRIDLKLEKRGLVVSLRESGFFASGDDRISESGTETIAKIAAVIVTLPNQIRLEGHTDSVPIHNSRFRSNWELSSARAIAMMELLRQRFGVPPARMAVAGYAENAPADTNDTEAGRAHNRRVDLVVLSEEGMRSEPGK